MRHALWIACVGLVAAAALAATTTPPLPPGDAATGRETFVKFRCNVCHSVAGQKPQAQVPLRDFSHETPEAVANLIVARMETAPEALFDEMAMSATASQMTMRELADVVEYLRNPGAAKH